MGLDNFASRNPKKIDISEEDVRAFEEAGISLCGGLVSDGVASFRGKVYDELITDVTGVSLYTDWISPERVSRMSERLDKYEPEQVKRDSENWQYEIVANDVRMLQKFFKVCAERGLGILAWG